MLKPDWPCARQNGVRYWLTTLVAAPRSSPATAAAIGVGNAGSNAHVAQRRRRRREHHVRTEVLTAAGGHTDDGAGRAHGGDGRVEDQRGAELGGHRLGQGRVAARDAHRLRLAVEHPRGHRGLLRDEEHREVGELRVVERDVGLLGDEPRLGNETERVEPRREAHADRARRRRRPSRGARDRRGAARRAAASSSSTRR